MNKENYSYERIREIRKDIKKYNNYLVDIEALKKVTDNKVFLQNLETASEFLHKLIERANFSLLREEIKKN